VFDRATREELWEERDALEDFIQEPDVVERFISGELGNNLLFVYKSLAITQYRQELAELADRTIRQVLREAGQDSPEHIAFLEDALAYHTSRIANLFDNRDEEPQVMLRHDVAAFEAGAVPDRVEQCRLPEPASYRFVLDDSQRALIERFLNIYGGTPVGLSRILSKVYIRKLFRHAVTTNVVHQGNSEQHYQIAGLQN